MQDVRLERAPLHFSPDIFTISWRIPLTTYNESFSQSLLRDKSMYTWRASSFSTLFFDRTVKPGESVQATIRVYLPPLPVHPIPDRIPEDINSAMPTAVGVQLFPFPLSADTTSEYPTPDVIKYFESFPLGLHTYSAAFLLRKQRLANGTSYSYCSPLKHDEEFYIAPTADPRRPHIRPNPYTDVTVIIRCRPIRELLQEYLTANDYSTRSEHNHQKLLNQTFTSAHLKRSHMLSISFSINGKELRQQYFSDVFSARIGVCS